MIEYLKFWLAGLLVAFVFLVAGWLLLAVLDLIETTIRKRQWAKAVAASNAAFAGAQAAKEK